MAKPNPFARTSWDKVKVVDQPVFRVGYPLVTMTPGKMTKDRIPPSAWLEAGIRAGLVEMVSPKEAKAGARFIDRIDGQPLEGMKVRPLAEVVAEGMARTLKELEELNGVRKG